MALFCPYTVIFMSFEFMTLIAESDKDISEENYFYKVVYAEQFSHGNRIFGISKTKKFMGTLHKCQSNTMWQPQNKCCLDYHGFSCWNFNPRKILFPFLAVVADQPVKYYWQKIWSRLKFEKYMSFRIKCKIYLGAFLKFC